MIICPHFNISSKRVTLRNLWQPRSFPPKWYSFGWEQNKTKNRIHLCSTCPACLNIPEWLSIHWTWKKKSKSVVHLTNTFQWFTVFTVKLQFHAVDRGNKNNNAEEITSTEPKPSAGESFVPLSAGVYLTVQLSSCVCQTGWRVTCTLLKDHRKNTETLWQSRVKTHRK